MFESIAILPNSARKHPLSIGELAEKMLYYKEVILFASKEDLQFLFIYFEIDVLLEYLKRGYLKIKSRKKHYGVGLIGAAHIADFLYDQNYDLKKILTEAYFAYSNDLEKSKVVANLLYKHIGIYETPVNFAREVDRDLSDQEFTKQAIIETIKHYRPHDEIDMESFDFIAEPLTNGQLVINSTIDKEKYPFLDPESIVLSIGTAIEDCKIAANYNCELSVPQLSSKIISLKFNSILTKATNSATNIESFQYAEFPASPSLKQVIDEKHKSMRDFLKVLEAGEKFKGWLTDLGEGNKLIKEYIAKVNEKTWLQSTPSKAARFYLIQGISTILKATGSLTGIAAGVTLSAANTFLIDKLSKGWKPNHYIEKEVVPFINYGTENK